MRRFFVPPQKVKGSTITVDDPKEIHHIRDVLRLGLGDRIACFDGQGREYSGIIKKQARAGVVIHIDQPAREIPQDLRIWLAQALPKADRFDWVIQKATELGAWRISPLISQRTVVRSKSGHKCARWQRIAQEAAKQCGRASIPPIDPPQSLEAFLALVGRACLILMPTLAVNAISLNEVLKTQTQAKEVVLLIGPEGDFTREEVALAETYGARPVSLGALTLRAETAALASLAILRYALVGL